ncbi:hypothetical protein [Salinimicrobium oceani]|uniref:Uncharacterized protein n=1 Tax=Salinimicrobium oceani TaxID=2722702 RepID=A0ABX1CYC0_9FLAO|nr:hypothetical protein [Salinimicrobium oceani]NJW51808.1 hypothetical protein [Salinimicrobium oceani]
MKKTIAILGDAGGDFPNGISILMEQDLRLLFVSENGAQKKSIRESLAHQGAAELDFTSCEREGCWEADLIMMLNQETPSASLVARIKEVATQKVVINAFEGTKPATANSLIELFPWSKVAEIALHPAQKEIEVYSSDTEARAAVQSLFAASGYEIKYN